MKKALAITTLGEATIIDLNEGSLEKLQKAVGGYVQAIDLCEGLTMWCNEEGKLTIGEFLYSCFWTFTSLRPDWVPDDPRHQQMIHTSYLLPSGMQFNFPEAMNSLALKLLESDMGLFLYWVEEKYYFDDVFDRSIDVGVRTPISSEDDPDAKRTSNTLGYLIFSAGIT